MIVTNLLKSVILQEMECVLVNVMLFLPYVSYSVFITGNQAIMLTMMLLYYVLFGICQKKLPFRIKSSETKSGKDSSAKEVSGMVHLPLLQQLFSPTLGPQQAFDKVIITCKNMIWLLCWLWKNVLQHAKAKQNY